MVAGSHVSSGKHMPNLRRSERTKTLWGAKIIFNNRMSTMDCVVKNISSSGAKLALSASLPVPNEFELHIPRKGRSYRARLVRRDSEGIGVALPFVDAKRPTEARVHELELENAQLKARIHVLNRKARGSGAGSENRQYFECREGEGLLCHLTQALSVYHVALIR